MSTAMLLIFLGSCMAGAVIQTVAGFGFGIFVITIFPYLFPTYAGAVAVSSLLSFSNTACCTLKMFRHINWRQVLIPLAGYTVTSFLSIRFFSSMDDLLMKALGAVLILLSIYFLFFNGKIHIRPTAVNGLIAGALGGILNGLFGMGGPPMVVYLLAVTKDNNEYMGTIQAYFTIGDLISTAARFLSGIMTWSLIRYWLLGSLAVFLGVRVGSRIFARLDGTSLRKCIYGYMIFSGILLLLR